MFENFKKFRNISNIFEKYFGKYWEIFSKKVSNNILVNCRNFFKNFQKKNSENFEVYCGEFWELFQKFFFNFGTLQKQTMIEFWSTTEDVCKNNFKNAG